MHPNELPLQAVPSRDTAFAAFFLFRLSRGMRLKFSGPGMHWKPGVHAPVVGNGK